MRVLALVTDAFGGHGGIAQYNRDFIGALAGTDSSILIDIVPSNPQASGSAVPDGIHQHRGNRSRLAYVIKVLSIVLVRGPFDVVFCGHLHLAPLAAVVAKLGKAKLWLQLHGIEAWDRPGRLRRLAAECVDMVTAVSRHTRRQYLSWAAIDPQRVRVLPDTVDDRYGPGPRRDDLVRKYGLKDKKVILTVGRLSDSERYKGHDRVIRCMPGLLRELPDLTYLVAGDGPDRERLAALVNDAGVEHAVRFLGRVEAGDLPDIYRLADVYVMPSTGEGFGIVFLEALATGLPVIGGNRDGSVDPLADGELGILVDPDDAAGLQQAILHALRSNGVNRDRTRRFHYSRFSGQVGRLAAGLAGEAA